MFCVGWVILSFVLFESSEEHTKCTNEETESLEDAGPTSPAKEEESFEIKVLRALEALKNGQTNLQNGLTDLQNGQTNLRKDLADVMKMDGNFAYKKGKMTAVQFEVNSKMPMKNRFASGNIFSLNNKYYVGTNKHVLVKKKNGIPICKRELVKITNYLNEEVTISRPIMISEKVDMAFAEIKEIPFGMDFLNVSTKKVEAGQKLFGISIRDGQIVAIECMVHVSNETYAESNCGDSYGFSGVGYVDWNGTLLALHISLGNMLELDWEDEGDVSGMSTEEDYFKDKCNEMSKACFGIKKGGEDCQAAWGSCLKASTTFIYQASRNPRTTIVHAF